MLSENDVHGGRTCVDVLPYDCATSTEASDSSDSGAGASGSTTSMSYLMYIIFWRTETQSSCVPSCTVRSVYWAS